MTDSLNLPPGEGEVEECEDCGNPLDDCICELDEAGMEADDEEVCPVCGEFVEDCECE